MTDPKEISTIRRSRESKIRPSKRRSTEVVEYDPFQSINLLKGKFRALRFQISDELINLRLRQRVNAQIEHHGDFLLLRRPIDLEQALLECGTI